MLHGKELFAVQRRTAKALLHGKEAFAVRKRTAKPRGARQSLRHTAKVCRSAKAGLPYPRARLGPTTHRAPPTSHARAPHQLPAPPPPRPLPPSRRAAAKPCPHRAAASPRASPRGPRRPSAAPSSLRPPPRAAVLHRRRLRHHRRRPPPPPGSPYASSPESAPKRAPRSSSPPPPQDRPETEPEPEHEGNNPSPLAELASAAERGHCAAGAAGSAICGRPRCFEEDTGGSVARVSEGASRIFFEDKETMSLHLIKSGFKPSYKIWTFHGEKAKKRARKEVRQIQPTREYDTGFDRCLENLANGNVPESPHVEAETSRDAETSEEPEENTKKYFEVDTNGDGQKRQTTVAKNILRYLPVLPRIQRLFMTEDTAQQMRWAVEGIRPDSGKMIHPSDGTAWKNFVKKYPLKAGDPRSVAIAISTDGFNPYGPKYPGKNMNVYLEPLIDDLLLGWEDRGIRTYDAAKKEHFDMQAVTFFWLNKGGKYSCFDEARQFLEQSHEYRSDVKSFKKGRVVHAPKPIPKTGHETKAELDALQPNPDGNGFLGYGETHQWTHKPCFWKLPYFEFLSSRITLM
ncbi:hypothetical protein QYE76_045190 [Lolium multiflorum]|uniref:Transposase n=1 Tax=Lolium multiflorum TaxID=4521 RepID=A0AAD8TM85_LOLMU|nr:hypothetical protein QYE76_045190 [Lolium multiflorum]